MPLEAATMAKKVASMPVGDAGGASASRTHAASSGSIAIQSGSVATRNPHACRSNRQRWRKSRIDAGWRRPRSVGTSRACHFERQRRPPEGACMPFQAAALAKKVASMPVVDVGVASESGMQAA
jgi:hypothetical protein